MANGFLSTDSLVPYGNQMIPNTVATAPRLKPKGDGKNDKLALMLYALGGALRGDKNFVENTMKLQQMQEGKKREKQMKENWEKAFANIEEEGLVNPTLISLAKVLKPEQAANLIASGLPKKEKLTAAQQNLEAYQQIVKTGTPEEINVAKAALIGIRQGKSREQLKNEVVANLVKQRNPITGEPYSKEEIEQQVKILDEFYGKSAEVEVEQDKPLTFTIPGYTIEEG